MPPIPGPCWRHVVIGTKNSWLPGDSRGWRSRKHRRHSSGDYKSPPPVNEHAGLQRSSCRRAGEPVIIPRELRRVVGLKLIEELETYRILTVAVTGMHVHLLMELPESLPDAKAIVGDAKAAASLAIRKHLPGSVWAGGGSFRQVTNRSWQRNVYHYIRDKQGPGAWRWTFREGDLGLL